MNNRLMRFVTVMCLVVIGGATWLGLVPTACGETYHNEQAGYALDLPDDWIEIPREVMEEVMAQVMQQGAGPRIQYSAGFQPAANETWMEYPYVLVQVLPYAQFGPPRQIREDEFPKLIKALTGLDLAGEMDKRMTDEARSMVSDIQTGVPRLDRPNRRFFLTMDMNVATVGVIKGQCVGYFGRKALVQVMFYVHDDEMDAYADVSAGILESLKFDAAHAYDGSAAAQSSGSGVVGRTARHYIIAGVVGAAIAGVYGLIRMLRNKRQDTDVMP